MVWWFFMSGSTRRLNGQCSGLKRPGDGTTA